MFAIAAKFSRAHLTLVSAAAALGVHLCFVLALYLFGRSNPENVGSLSFSEPILAYLESNVSSTPGANNRAILTSTQRQSNTLAKPQIQATSSPAPRDRQIVKYRVISDKDISETKRKAVAHQPRNPQDSKSVTKLGSDSRPPRFGLGSSRNPHPDYPYRAKILGLEGTVVLRVEVGLDGKAHNINVERSSGERSFDESALTTVRRWIFFPALDRGVPTTGYVLVPIEFKLLDSES